jgi:transposase InsO family protein
VAIAIVQHHGRPHTPTDQAQIEMLFGHVKGEWPHLEGVDDAELLESSPVTSPCGRAGLL